MGICQTVVRTHHSFPVYSIQEYFLGEIIYTIDSWTFNLFLGAADCELVCNSFRKKRPLTVAAVVMILRVWAMYNRSRLILGTLLTLFSLGTIPSIVGTAIDSNLKKLSGM